MHWLALLGLLLLCIGWAPGALAAVTCTTPTSVLDLPDVSVSANTPVGAVLGTPTQVSITFTCSGLPYNNTTLGQTATIQVGDLTTIDTANDPPSGGGIMFRTNKSGISLMLTASPIQASDNACLRCGPNSTKGWEATTITYPNTSATITLTAQLVKTGSVTTGTVPKISTVLDFYSYVYGYTASVGPFGAVSFNSVNVTAVSCGVSIGSQNSLTVSLPTISTRTLTGKGSVAGATQFNITYQCSTGSKLSMSMSSATAYSTSLGVISSSSTCPNSSSAPAANVGVQVLQSSGSPMSFTTAQSLGNSPNGTLTIPYTAQYYQTGNTVTAGPVCATATFTMSYN